MKKIIIVLSLFFFVCSTMIVVPQVRADSSGAAQGALIGALIGAVIGAIVLIFSVSSEKPMDKNIPEKANKLSDNSEEETIAKGSFSNVQMAKEKATVISAFPFKIAF